MSGVPEDTALLLIVAAFFLWFAVSRFLKLRRTIRRRRTRKVVFR